MHISSKRSESVEVIPPTRSGPGEPAHGRQGYESDGAALMRLFRIVCRGSQSWWVLSCPRGPDGAQLPFARVVFFARSQEQARDWVEKQHLAAGAA